LLATGAAEPQEVVGDDLLFLVSLCDSGCKQLVPPEDEIDLFQKSEITASQTRNNPVLIGKSPLKTPRPLEQAPPQSE
jgi:hypothetical protein